MNIAIFGYYGNKNTGDELILQVLGEYLHKFALHEPLDVKVLPSLSAPLDYDPKIEGVCVISYSNSRFFSRLGIFPHALHTDLLIIGGGGLIQDHESTGSGPIRTLLKRALIVRLFGGRVVLLAIGVSKLVTSFGRLQTRLLCKICDFVTVRDVESAIELNDIGVPSAKVAVTGDLALLWEPSVSKNASLGGTHHTKHYVVSVLPYHEERFERMENTLAFRKEFASALDYLVQENDGYITFLSFQGVPENYDKREAEAIARFMKFQHRCRILEYVDDYTKLSNEIKSSSLLIGMRLHSIVLARLCNIPFIAVSYHEKVSNFADSIGKPEWTVCREDVSKGALKRKIEQYLDQETTWRCENELWNQKKNAYRNFEILEEYIKANSW